MPIICVSMLGLRPASGRQAILTTNARHWAARTVQMKAQVKRPGEEVAEAIFNRRTHSVEQALKVAQQHNISRNETDVPADQLPDSELFLWAGRCLGQAGKPTVGPEYDLDYDQNRAMLASTLNVRGQR